MAIKYAVRPHKNKVLWTAWSGTDGKEHLDSLRQGKAINSNVVLRVAASRADVQRMLMHTSKQSCMPVPRQIPARSHPSGSEYEDGDTHKKVRLLAELALRMKSEVDAYIRELDTADAYDWHDDDGEPSDNRVDEKAKYANDWYLWENFGLTSYDALEDFLLKEEKSEEVSWEEAV